MNWAINEANFSPILQKYKRYYKRMFLLYQELAKYIQILLSVNFFDEKLALKGTSKEVRIMRFKILTFLPLISRLTINNFFSRWANLKQRFDSFSQYRLRFCDLLAVNFWVIPENTKKFSWNTTETWGVFTELSKKSDQILIIFLFLYK